METFEITLRCRVEAENKEDAQKKANWAIQVLNSVSYDEPELKTLHTVEVDRIVRPA